jgi:hypothetical protein
MSAQYEPREGDYVTVRRYIQPTTGERTLYSEHMGQITLADREADGYRIWLNTLPDDEWIFTGCQFLGQGVNGRGPASLVTEVAPAAQDGHRVQLTPDLALLLDAGLCIVAEIADPAAGGEVLRRVTITNVDAVKSALDALRTVQHEHEHEADLRRAAGPGEKRRAEGRYTKREVVEELVSRGIPRFEAVGAASRAGRHAGTPAQTPDGVSVTRGTDSWYRVTPEAASSSAAEHDAR